MAIIIYDGDCGICQRSVQFALKRSRSQPDVLANQKLAQFPELSFIPQKLAEKQVLWFDGEKLYAGSRAIAEIFKTMSGLWPTLGFLINLPGLRNVSQLIYLKIAGRRHKISELLYGKACEIPNQDKQRKE
jgi:predicted DCC family thiol-disulfide oxidoreductase YuxK